MRGRKDKWTQLDMENRLDEVAQLAYNTKTDKDLYELLGISYNLFYEWLREREDFKRAIEIGRTINFKDMIDAQKKKALGYWERKPPRIKKVKERNEETGRLQIIREEILDDWVFVPPSTEAARFVAESEGNNKYVQLKELEYLSNIVKDMTKEQLREFIKGEKEDLNKE